MRYNSDSAMRLFVDRLAERTPLGEDEIRAFRSLEGQTSLARANVDIVTPGESTTYACLIVEGLAGRFGQVIDGRRQITALHIAGDMCDLHSVVLPKVSWALQALSSTVILRIKHRDILQVAEDFPRVAQAFWRDCAVDASILSQWVVNLGRRDAPARMAHLLCEMAVRMENSGLGLRGEFKLEASQTQLGDALGLTSIHVNRTFKLLRDNRLITTEGRTVRICNWQALARLGDFDEDYLYAGRGDAYRRALRAS